MHNIYGNKTLYQVCKNYVKNTQDKEAKEAGMIVLHDVKNLPVFIYIKTNPAYNLTTKKKETLFRNIKASEKGWEFTKSSKATLQELKTSETYKLHSAKLRRALYSLSEKLSQ